MHKEGYIKFNCRWTRSAAPGLCQVQELILWRDRLYRAGLTGVTPEGIGYGNLSARLQGNEFLITGSGSGRHARLTSEHFTHVTSFDIRANSLACKGPIEASSESLTHAAVYMAAPEVNAVFHIHHTGLWKKYLDVFPATAPEAEYGTPEMAESIIKLVKNSARGNCRVIVMTGHEGGLISYGETPDEAGEGIMELKMKNER